MHAFHAAIHALPPHAAQGPHVAIEGVDCQTLAIRPQSLSAPLPVTFDQAAGALARLPRLFVEPDGALVWTGTEPTSWRVDGALFRAKRFQDADAAHLSISTTVTLSWNPEDTSAFMVDG